MHRKFSYNYRKNKINRICFLSRARAKLILNQHSLSLLRKTALNDTQKIEI